MAGILGDCYSAFMSSTRLSVLPSRKFFVGLVSADRSGLIGTVAVQDRLLTPDSRSTVPASKSFNSMRSPKLKRRTRRIPKQPIKRKEIVSITRYSQ